MGARLVSVRLTDELVNELDRLAESEGISRNAILEVACYESLERWDGVVPREGVIKVLQDKKTRTREGLLRSQKKRGQVTLSEKTPPRDNDR